MRGALNLRPLRWDITAQHYQSHTKAQAGSHWKASSAFQLQRDSSQGRKAELFLLSPLFYFRWTVNLQIVHLEAVISHSRYW